MLAQTRLLDSLGWIKKTDFVIIVFVNDSWLY